MEFTGFGMFGESSAGESMDPVREESAEDGEIFRDADPAMPDG